MMKNFTSSALVNKATSATKLLQSKSATSRIITTTTTTTLSPLLNGGDFYADNADQLAGPGVELRYGLLALTCITVLFSIGTNVLLLVREAAANASSRKEGATSGNNRLKAAANNLRIPIFITIMTADDLAMALLNGILVYNATIDNGVWNFGEILCKIKEPLVQGVVGISCTLMMVIATERWTHMIANTGTGGGSSGGRHSYSFSSDKFSPAFSAKLQAFGITGAVIVGHLILALPLFLQAQYIDLTKDMPAIGETSDEIFCVQEWQSAPLFVTYRCTLLAVTFLIPLTVTLILHLKIIRHVHVMLRRSSITEGRRQTNQARTRFILIGVVISFAICWIPNQVLGTFMDIKSSGLFDVSDFSADMLRFWPYLPFVMSAFRMLIILQAGINPLLYGRSIQRYQTGAANSGDNRSSSS